MITANGKTVIKRFLARQIGQIGGALALGVGSAAPNVNDARLQYEVVRVPILSVNVDPNTDRIVFRANVAPGRIKSIYEIGVWSSSAGLDEGYTMNLLSNLPISWTNGTLTNSNARANANALQISYSANGTTNAELNGFRVDLSRFRDVDSVVVGYHATINLSSVRVRLGTDSSNYFEFLLPAHSANSYNVARLQRSAATRTGNPDWSAITYAAIRPSATAAGGGNIFFDGIRFEPNSPSENNLLIARSVLATPHNLDSNIVSDVEYALGINIT